MKIKYLALALLCAACTSQKPREIPVWDFTSDDPSAESPSESPSDSPSEEPSKDEPVPEKEYELTDLLVIDKVTATDCSIVVEYSFPKASKVKGCKWGLGWNAGGEDIIQWGPAMDSDGKVFQVISDALLDFGKTYSIRAFVDKEGKTLWTEPSQAAMKDAPAALELEWNKLSRSVLPDGIELYETTSKVSERNFHAWYALADLGKVDLRVNVPSEAITIDDQSAAQDDCMVMINGGYFYNGRHTGLAVTAGKENGAIPSVRGSLRSGDEEFNIMYNVTRGIFGVDAQGRPAVYWAGTGNSFNFYFDRPLPSVRGESKYGAISVSNPAAPVDWKPEYALSAGP